MAAALILGLAACKEPTRAPEAGAFLLRLTVAPAAPVPDELRLSIYDDTGALWKDVRFPDEGGLVPEDGSRLGSILIQPGALQGDLRVHARGLTQGARMLEAILRVQRDAVSRATFDLTLETTVLVDGDLDGVPDQIDDCPATSNPGQQGCLDGGTGLPDGAGPADGPDDGGAVDAPSALSDGAIGIDALLAADTRSGPDAGVAADAAPGADLGSGGMDAGSDTRVDSGPDAGTGADVASTIDAAPDAGTDATTPPDVQVPDAGKANGVACGAAIECQSEMCVDGLCCSTACLGLCRSCNQPGRDGTCVAYALGADPEQNCAGTATCNGAGACGAAPVGRKSNGQICAAATECTSGFCADGVCCNAACDLPCQACATGTCQSVTRMQDIPQCVSPQRCNPQAKCS